jgi:hypothetical protein
LEEINCTGSECLLPRLLIAMRGGKDNGDTAIGSEQPGLQFKAAYAGYS